MTTGVVQVQTTLPDAESAQALAATLLEERLAACVQVTGPLDSRYRWQGKLEHATEWLCLIKSTTEAVPRLLSRIRALHPYETPELIVLPGSDGDAEYLRWVKDSVRGER